MSTSKFFVDIHCHPTMKPFYSAIKQSAKKSIWEEIPESQACEVIRKNPKWPIESNLVKELNKMAKSSQMNLDSCQKGDVQVLFVSLYPVERGWFKTRSNFDIVTSDEFMIMSSICSSGFDEKVVRAIERDIIDEKEINYFHDLVKEYIYLNSAQAASKATSKKFIIANSYQEMEAVINDPNDNSIVLIISIEGGHSLCNFKDFDDLSETPFRKVNNANKAEFKKYSALFLKHINIIKGKENTLIEIDGVQESIHFQHSPFYITFAHHFWNLLCGHADSFGFGADLAFDQGRAKNRKFTELGKLVLRKLLFRDANERRILIDIKHLSIHARKEFFEMWEEEYQSINDPFPIICSHTAVNGLDDYNAITWDFGEYNSSIFNTSSINMFDEDIRMIHKSKGLIGIMLSKSRLLGEETLDETNYNLEQMEKDPSMVQELTEENKEEFMKSIAANIFHIAKVIAHESAWDIISIGSDFDGMINPLNNYEKAEGFPDLSRDLVSFIDRCDGIEEMEMSKKEMNELMGNYSSSEIIDKFMQKNAMNFCKRYFHDSFLKDGIVGL